MCLSVIRASHSHRTRAEVSSSPPQPPTERNVNLLHYVEVFSHCVISSTKATNYPGLLYIYIYINIYIYIYIYIYMDNADIVSLMCFIRVFLNRKKL